MTNKICDFISGVIFLPHRRLKGGLFASIDIDKDGNPFIAKTTEKRLLVEGTYSSMFTIRTCHNYDSIQDEYLDKIAEMGLKKGECAFIEFSGNAVKFLQGHNIFGTSDIYFLAYQSLKKCLQTLALSELIPNLKKSINENDWRVTRIDITTMLQLDTNEQVDDYIYQTSRTSHIRSGNIEFTKNTLYFQKHSTAWSMKMYNKFRELCSRSKKHQLPLPLKFSGLKEWVEGQLRIELTLRKKELDKNENSRPENLQKNINNLFNEYLERIEMKPQKEIENLQVIPRHVQGTYLLWKQHLRVKEILPHNTYYRHRRELLSFGIDIAVAPLTAEQQHTEFKTIKQVLEPKEVTIHHIPQVLRQYLAAPSSQFRRVA